MADKNMSLLKRAMEMRKKQRDAIAFAKSEKAAKARGEMGYNPSGTQGAKDTEAKYMNPAMYGENKKKTKRSM